jgi:hypothetical protein
MRALALACVATVASAVTIVAGPRPAADEPTLAVVLQRSAAYVAEFQARLSSLVAEETYVQDWYAVAGESRSLGHRELRSDLVLMKPDGAASWVEFRDVFEVDGRTIRPRDGRLEQMLLAPADGNTRHVAAILEESARFNLGDVDRNVNTPLFSLRFLEADNQPRFRFERTAVAARDAAPDDVRGGAVFRAATEVWVVGYREVRSRTLIRTAQRRDQPARGRFWIEPATGRVLISELVIDDRTVKATIEVSFQSKPLLDMLVPVAMRERYVGKRTGTVVEGLATYGGFRRLGAGPSPPGSPAESPARRPPIDEG